mmetsp:Transcript_21343/g.51391  ORF Transcript_21343/g.51391 Transcript_21343/m.51391 type:complete len:452 (-) Transcript_21343:101-1456(-)
MARPWLSLFLLLAHASTLSSAFCPAFPTALGVTTPGKLSSSALRSPLACGSGCRAAARIGAGRPRQGTLVEGLQMNRKAHQGAEQEFRVTVLGGGSFGLAMASVLGKQGIPVTLLMRKQNDVDHFNTNKRHPTYLKDIVLPECVSASCDPPSALSDATHLIHAVPCQYSREYLRNIAPLIPKGIPLVCTSKGIEAGTLAMMNDILVEELGPDRSYAFLSGPSFAKEIAMGLATAVVVASKDTAFGNEVAEMFSCETFRVFTTKDVAGVEIGGAVKNVIAIAAGMCEGLGMGTNAMAGLVTRGCLEMQALAKAIGASPVTLMGLSGVGDTFGTCFGPLSRNRQLGFRLGQGEKLEDILTSTTEVAEGYATALSLVEFLREKLPRSYRMDLKFPILFGVADILKGERTPSDAMREIMMLPIRTEVFDYRENSVQALLERKRRAAAMGKVKKTQ